MSCQLNPEDFIMQNFFDKLKEASSIRGIVILLGVIGYSITPDQVSDLVALAAVIVYGLYELFRTDSSQKAIVEVMKRIGSAKFIIPCFLALSMLAGITQAADLYISAEGTVTEFDVSIEDPGAGSITYNHPDITDFEAIGPDAVHGGTRYRIMNMDSLDPGIEYRIIVKACNGAWCTVSDPLLTGRPGIRPGSMIVQ
jgi:hypothetical protein